MGLVCFGEVLREGLLDAPVILVKPMGMFSAFPDRNGFFESVETPKRLLFPIDGDVGSPLRSLCVAAYSRNFGAGVAETFHVAMVLLFGNLSQITAAVIGTISIDVINEVGPISVEYSPG